MQNFLAVWVLLIFIPRLPPKLFTHVNILFIYMHDKLVSESSSSKLCHFSIGEFHFSYSFPMTVLSLRAQWICKYFLLTDFDIFIQMNSVRILWLLILRKRGMRSPLIPYLISASTESMMLCSIIQPNNQTWDLFPIIWWIFSQAVAADVSSRMRFRCYSF